MTDKEIIKALEEYIELRFDDTEYATVRLCTLTNALDLINRLQAQNKDLAETIHNLTLEKDALFDKAEELKVEVERLENALLALMNYLNISDCDESDVSFIKISTDLNKQIRADIKSEAVKEFAKRLKCGVPQETGVIRCSDIDNLTKEMVGENK